MPATFSTTAPLVSVIVRSMDRASLARTLLSVVQQRHRPIELVLVNALGQAHAPLPAQLADLVLRVVAAEDGQALPRARAAQAGLQAATGDWALFLDDDDELLPEHLSHLLQAGQQHAEAPAVFSDVEMGRYVDGEWLVEHGFAAGFDPVRLLFENYVPIHAVLFRRELAQRAACFDTALNLFEDWDFWLQLAQLGAFVHVPGASARYVAAAAPGQSEVFEDSAAARAARGYLFEKWRLRISPDLHAQALYRLQALYREAAQCQAQLADLQRGHAELGAVLQARQADAEGFAPLLAARETEIANARLELAAQHSLLAAREAELANALAAIEAQADVLNHRDREIREGAEYAHSLREALTRSEQEAAANQQQLADLGKALAQRERELATLQAESPLQALTRTLRSSKKNHASRS